MKKNVVSYCLWGDNPKYTVGAVKNVELVKQYYPGYESWIYTDASSVPGSIISQLKEQGAKLINRPQGGWHSMFWRFEPAADPSVDVVLVRDTDCRIGPREKAAVEEWLASGKRFHIMRDHPAHGIEILGGLWGARGGILKKLPAAIARWNIVSAWQNDQSFLKEKIWPVVHREALIHDEWWRPSQARAFPTPRQGLEFVGEPFGPNDEIDVGNRRILKDRLNQKGEINR